MLTVEVVGIRLELPANQPVLILRHQESARYLPLWIGTSEAAAISIALEGIAAPRPLTHDLLADVIKDLGATLASVSISELTDGVFFALLNFTSHDAISARPSDAVALAIRCGVPIFVNPEVMDAAGMVFSDTDDDSEEDEQEQLEQFRAFLEEINPEDF